MSQSPVVILGGGLGGLTLGRCLRQKGIASIIYDRASNAPRHTYGITLEPSAYKPLLRVLDIDEISFKKKVAVDSQGRDGVGRISAGGTEHSVAFRANRNKLESLLRDGQTVQPEHSLSSASIPDDGGSVELRFENGLKLRPTQVVDALGVHSRLRRSLLPNIALEVQPFAVYSGKRYVNANTFTSIYAPAFGNGNVVVRSPSNDNGARIEISVNDHLPDGNISISYIYSRAARSDSMVKDPLHHPERPIAGTTDIPDELFSELNEFLAADNVGQPFIECFDTEKVRTERVLHWLMRTVIIPKQELLQLLRHGVVMIGDSVHAVPILGGHGANMAILDAIDLANVLAERREQDTKLQDFYEHIWPGWRDAVEASKQSLEHLHRGPSKSSLI